MVRRDDVPWAEVQKLNAQGWSYRPPGGKIRRLLLGHRPPGGAGGLARHQRPAGQCPAAKSGRPACAARRSGGWPEDLDTREIKELTAVLRELMNLQQTLEGQQPGGGPLRVELAEETEDWSL